MCGILGAIVNPKAKKKIDANEFIINQFEDQNGRGKEGFGIIRMKDGKIEGVDRACTPMKFFMDLYTNKAESIIAHHRTPTSTSNKMDQTHPMFVSNKELKFDYYVIHNGMIRNDDALKKIHEGLGYKYLTETTEEKYRSCNYVSILTKFNDSETMAIDIARYIEELQPKMKIEGSAAFVAIQVKKGTQEIQKIYWGRRTNPINMDWNKGYILLSSEGPGEEIDENILYSINIKNPKFYKNGKWKIMQEQLNFEDERLETEKATKEAKEKEERKDIIGFGNPDHENTNTTQKFNFPQKTILLSNAEKERKVTISEEYKKEIADLKEKFQGDLKALDDTYWEFATAGTDRSDSQIIGDLGDAFEDRKDLIMEVLQSYADIMATPGYSKDDEKPRRHMTMQLWSEILESIEKICNYEAYNLEQIDINKDEEEEDMKAYNESFGITDKGKEALAKDEERIRNEKRWAKEKENYDMDNPREWGPYNYGRRGWGEYHE